MVHMYRKHKIHAEQLNSQQRPHEKYITLYKTINKNCLFILIIFKMYIFFEKKTLMGLLFDFC